MKQIPLQGCKASTAQLGELRQLLIDRLRKLGHVGVHPTYQLMIFIEALKWHHVDRSNVFIHASKPFLAFSELGTNSVNGQ